MKVRKYISVLVLFMISIMALSQDKYVYLCYNQVNDIRNVTKKNITQQGLIIYNPNKNTPIVIDWVDVKSLYTYNLTKSLKRRLLKYGINYKPINGAWFLNEKKSDIVLSTANVNSLIAFELKDDKKTFIDLTGYIMVQDYEQLRAFISLNKKNDSTVFHRYSNVNDKQVKVNELEGFSNEELISKVLEHEKHLQLIEARRKKGHKIMGIGLGIIGLGAIVITGGAVASVQSVIYIGGFIGFTGGVTWIVGVFTK